MFDKYKTLKIIVILIKKILKYRNFYKSIRKPSPFSLLIDLYVKVIESQIGGSRILGIKLGTALLDVACMVSFAG